MANGIWVKVKNHERYKGRADVEHNSWFRCSNRLLEDPDFYDFSHAELLTWVLILSLSSIRNSADVFVNFERAEKVCRIKRKDILSAIKKLADDPVACIDVTSTLRPRNADDTSTCATDITDITDRQDRQDTIAGPTGPDLDFDFESIYREYPRKEGKAKGLKLCKAQVRSEADYQALKLALVRYKDHVKNQGTEAKFIKHFSTFMGSWRDWLDPETGQAEDFSEKAQIYDWNEIIGTKGAG